MQFLSDVVTILLQFHKCQNIREALEILSELGYNRLNCEARISLPAGCIWYVRASALGKRNYEEIRKSTKNLQMYKRLLPDGRDEFSRS